MPLVTEGWSLKVPYDDVSAAVLARREEDRYLEHKETIKFDVRTGGPNKALLDAVVERVCGFWNAGGGVILVGVHDRTGVVTGLERDLELYRDLDAMIGAVTSKLSNEVPTVAPFVHVTAEPIEDKKILRISTPKGNHPAFRDGQFWLRVNNTTSNQKADAATAYISGRFPGAYTSADLPDWDEPPTDAQETGDGYELGHDPRHDPNADPSNSFYHWTTLEERLEELNNRLAAWYVSGEQLPEIFAEALRLLQQEYDSHGNPLEAPPVSLLKAFEDALDSFDNILLHFPEELPDEPGF